MLDLRKIAVQLLQQEQQNRWAVLLVLLVTKSQRHENTLRLSSASSSLLLCGFCRTVRHVGNHIAKYLCIITISPLPPLQIKFSPASLSVLFPAFSPSTWLLRVRCAASRRRSLICRAESLIHRRRVTGRAHRWLDFLYRHLHVVRAACHTGQINTARVKHTAGLCVSVSPQVHFHFLVHESRLGIENVSTFDMELMESAHFSCLRLLFKLEDDVKPVRDAL